MQTAFERRRKSLSRSRYVAETTSASRIYKATVNLKSTLFSLFHVATLQIPPRKPDATGRHRSNLRDMKPSRRHCSLIIAPALPSSHRRRTDPSRSLPATPGRVATGMAAGPSGLKRICWTIVGKKNEIGRQKRLGMYSTIFVFRNSDIPAGLLVCAKNPLFFLLLGGHSSLLTYLCVSTAAIKPKPKSRTSKQWTWTNSFRRMDCVRQSVQSGDT